MKIYTYTYLIVRSHHLRLLMTFLIYKEFRSQSSHNFCGIFLFVFVQMEQINILDERARENREKMKKGGKLLLTCHENNNCDAYFIMIVFFFMHKQIGKFKESFYAYSNQHQLIVILFTKIVLLNSKNTDCCCCYTQHR